MNYLYLQDSTMFGHKRRNEIKQWFNQNSDGCIAINRKWQTQLKYDPDLRKLVKSGFLKQIRQSEGIQWRQGGWKKSGCRQTYLVKA